MDDAIILLLWTIWAAYGYMLWRWGTVSLYRTKGSVSRPSSALLLPARNEAQHLPACIDSLLQQTLPPTEIWIINDHSEDDTLHIARAYAERTPSIHVLSLPPDQSGKKAALRAGIEASHSEIIITTDADTQHLPDTIEKLTAPFTDPAIQVVGGWIRLAPEHTFLNAFQRIEMAGVLWLTAGSWQRGEPITANGALLAYRRKAFEVVGGWGTAMHHPSGDDDLLVQRIRLHFGRAAIAFSDAVVETQAAPTWKAFLQQRLRWLSKRRLYPAPWTRWGLGVLALAQVSLIWGLLYEPLHGALGWLMVSSAQACIAYRSFRFTKSPLPQLHYWIYTAAVYPLYQVVLIGLAWLRLPFEWKGRRYKA